MRVADPDMDAQMPIARGEGIAPALDAPGFVPGPVVDIPQLVRLVQPDQRRKFVVIHVLHPSPKERSRFGRKLQDCSQTAA